MKTYKLLFTVFSLFILSGCKEEGYSFDDYWVSIGTIVGNKDNYIVITDDGDRLFPYTTYVPAYPIINGKRLWVNYTILWDAEEDKDFDYYVRINDFSNILTKDIFILTPENADSIGHDPVWVYEPDKDIWISNNYLNIFFVYKGSPYWSHYINVVSDINNPVTPAGKPILELRHNSNNDPYNEPSIKGFVSINLLSMLEEGQDSVVFVLRAIDENGNYALNEELTYKYTTPIPIDTIFEQQSDTVPLLLNYKIE